MKAMDLLNAAFDRFMAAVNNCTEVLSPVRCVSCIFCSNSLIYVQEVFLQYVDPVGWFTGMASDL